MKCNTFEICFEISDIIEEEIIFHCENCKGTIHNWRWKCKECGKEVCTHCLLHFHLHGKNLKELDEQIYLEKYKERDEARELARQAKTESQRLAKEARKLAKEAKIKEREEARKLDRQIKIKMLEEKKVEKDSMRILKEEERIRRWKERKARIVKNYSVKRTLQPEQNSAVKINSNENEIITLCEGSDYPEDWGM